MKPEDLLEFASRIDEPNSNLVELVATVEGQEIAQAFDQMLDTLDGAMWYAGLTDQQRNDVAIAAFRISKASQGIVTTREDGEEFLMGVYIFTDYAAHALGKHSGPQVDRLRSL